MEIGLETMAKIIEAIIDHNAMIKNFMLKSKDVVPEMRDASITMGYYLEKVAETIDRMRFVNTEYKQKMVKEDDGQSKKIMGIQTEPTSPRIAALTPGKKKPVKKKDTCKNLSTQTNPEIEVSLTLVPESMLKRKDITPPIENAGKKSKTQASGRVPLRRNDRNSATEICTPRSEEMTEATDSEWETVQPRKTKTGAGRGKVTENNLQVEAS
ncbi:uncharacterized protein LOC117611005 [Osmia lignaria lignaria]|uniref:uncharacterized protein LOC117611005 n=1 Tax=Osmia lignaria lignaria TaxID=1437193 RepID=UPI00402BC66C